MHERLCGAKDSEHPRHHMKPHHVSLHGYTLILYQLNTSSLNRTPSKKQMSGEVYESELEASGLHCSAFGIQFQNELPCDGSNRDGMEPDPHKLLQIEERQRNSGYYYLGATRLPRLRGHSLLVPMYIFHLSEHRYRGGETC